MYYHTQVPRRVAATVHAACLTEVQVGFLGRDRGDREARNITLTVMPSA